MRLPSFRAFWLLLLALAGASTAQAQRRILLTNDDGFDSPGIQALRQALTGAGYEVTVIAPQVDQSGRSSAMTTSAPDGVPLIRRGERAWSLAGTPVDCVQVALDVVMRDRPPDLIISGANFGENLGRPAGLVSGTIGAALHAVLHGVPAIAVSVGIDLAESRDRYPSTRAAFDSTAAFVVRLVRALETSAGPAFLPAGTLLNVNVPVPYRAIRGVRTTTPARLSTLDMIWSATGDSTRSDTVRVRPRFVPVAPGTDTEGDVSAFREKFITVSVLGTDLSPGDANLAPLGRVIEGLVPVPETEAVIHRDRFGVPHIYSDSEPAGFHALGYAQAADRLPQLLGGALWVQGRYAELMGEGALRGDIEMRRWRNWEEAQAGYARMSPALRENYRAFVAGVRQYMREHPEQVPAWAPELTPEGMVAVTRGLYFAGYNSQEGPQECAKSGATLELGAATTRDWPAPLGASNQWAILPARTAGGETMLLADPHVEVNNPFYYEYSMEAGALRSRGFAVGPLLWQAQSPRVAWALTTGHPDLWDCYAVETDADDPRRYRYDGELRTMEVRREVFRTAGGKTVEREFEYTRHNGVLSAVVARQGRTAYVVSMSQMHDAGLMDEEIYRMNRAGSVAELREALKTLGMMPQNVMAVDDQGHSYYLRAGKTPRRPSGYDWSAAVPGNMSATAWRGFHPLEEMIEVVDPPQGYMQNNNTAPDRLFADGNLEAASFPAYLFNDTPGRVTTRGERTLDVLSRARRFRVEDAVELAFDEQWIGTGPWQRALRHAMTAEPDRAAGLSAPARRLVQRILEFDGNARAESEAALNFWFWRREAGALLDSEARFASLRAFPWTEAQFTPEFSRALLGAAESAAAAQAKAVGDVDQPLGRLFRAGGGGTTWPVGGISIWLPGVNCLLQAEPRCESTMRAFFAPRESDAKGERVVTSGSQAMRLIVFGREPRTFTLYAFGQQSAAGSPHANDQAELMSRRRFKPALMTRDAVVREATSTVRLTVPSTY